MSWLSRCYPICFWDTLGKKPLKKKRHCPAASLQKNVAVLPLLIQGDHLQGKLFFYITIIKICNRQ